MTEIGDFHCQKAAGRECRLEAKAPAQSSMRWKQQQARLAVGAADAGGVFDGAPGAGIVAALGHG